MTLIATMCQSCRHCVSYPDGEAEPQFGEMVITSLEWVSECSRGYERKFSSGGDGCKGYVPASLNPELLTGGKADRQ